jgi:hypothetical protein
MRDAFCQWWALGLLAGRMCALITAWLPLSNSRAALLSLAARNMCVLFGCPGVSCIHHARVTVLAADHHC